MRIREQLKKNWIEALLLISSIILLLGNIGKRPIEKWDEQTNISVIKETRENFPMLFYENEPFLEKPPLYYYTGTAASVIFGEGPTVFRCISAVSGLALLAGIYQFSKKFISRSAARHSILAALATGQLFFVFGRFFTTHNLKSADLDAMQLSLITWTVYFLTLLIKNNSAGKIKNKNIRKTAALAGFLAGLAFLTKGVFALVPIICLLFYIILKKERTLCKPFLTLALTFCITTFPWHFYMYFANGREFLQEYFYFHILQRGASSIDSHSNDMAFYFRILTNPKMFAVPFILPAAIIHTLSIKKCLHKHSEIFIILANFLLVFTILLLSQTKLAWYLFYIYPFAFILIGRHLAAIKDFRRGDYLKRLARIYYIFSVLFLAGQLIFNLVHVFH